MGGSSPQNKTSSLCSSPQATKLWSSKIVLANNESEGDDTLAIGIFIKLKWSSFESNKTAYPEEHPYIRNSNRTQFL